MENASKSSNSHAHMLLGLIQLLLMHFKLLSKLSSQHRAFPALVKPKSDPVNTNTQLQPIQNIVHFLKEGSCGGGLVSGCFPTYTLFKVKHFIMRLPGCSSIKDAVRNTQDVLFSPREVIVPWTMNSLEITSFRKC